MATSSQAVALLVPHSVAAGKAMKARVNHAVIADQPTPVALDGKRRGEAPPLLTFRAFFGRHSFSFGTSRRNEIVLPAKGGLGAQHLHLHFEMHTSLLLLTDTSTSGTWVSTECSAVPQLLRQRTWPILSTTKISIGDQQQYQFQVRLTEDLRGSDMFLELFRAYMSSLELSPPLFVKPLASIQTPQVMHQGLYFRLHHVGPARYERINTCLRLSDGRLFAVKVIESDVSVHLAQAVMTSKGIGPPAEAVVLRYLSHPHIIRFVDDCTYGHETYIYTEFIPSGSLAGILSETSQRSFTIDNTRGVLKQCLVALAYLHGRGISHGSIRAESILLQSYTPLHIRLCNFARSREESDEIYLKADLADLGTLMSLMLDYVVDPLNVSTDCTPPWATLLAGLQQHDPSLQLNADECLADAWLLGKSEGKRTYATQGSGEGRAVKRPRGNEAYGQSHLGTDEATHE